MATYGKFYECQTEQKHLHILPLLLVQMTIVKLFRYISFHFIKSIEHFMVNKNVGNPLSNCIQFLFSQNEIALKCSIVKCARTMFLLCDFVYTFSSWCFNRVKVNCFAKLAVLTTQHAFCVTDITLTLTNAYSEKKKQ